MRELGLSETRALVLVGSVGAAIPFLGLMLARAGIAESYQFYILVGAFILYCVIASQAWHVALSRALRAEPDKPTTTDRPAETP
ncbi:MAG: hypothetical protein R3E54_06265 [Halioglobus sp.]